MLIQAPNPVGIDYKLQQFQTKMHSYLITKWGLSLTSANDYKCYDRCYRNQTKEGFKPEVYDQNGSYTDLLFNDNVKVQSFFGIGNTLNYSQPNKANDADVHLIFMVNLEKLKNTKTRPDEEVRQDIQSFLVHSHFRFILTSIQIGIDTVFSDYSAVTVKYRDMQPLHCFRFNFDNLYTFSDHECT